MIYQNYNCLKVNFIHYQLLWGELLISHVKTNHSSVHSYTHRTGSTFADMKDLQKNTQNFRLLHFIVLSLNNFEFIEDVLRIIENKKKRNLKLHERLALKTLAYANKTKLKEVKKRETITKGTLRKKLVNMLTA